MRVESLGGAWLNTIGGAAPADRNVIADNGLDGIAIALPGVLPAWETTVRNNYIGTDAFLTAAVPNWRHGVNISDATDNNIVSNVIANNAGHGITVTGTAVTTGNTISANSIYDNGGMGIDLDNNGITPNDPGDADAGPNNLQNYPVLTSASAWGAVAGSLNSTANTSFRIEFFSSPACDGTGHGEGRTYLGSQTVTTNAGGNAAFSFPGPALTSGHAVTATTTDQVAQASTSEFSACVTVSAAPEIGISGNGVPIADGDTTPSLADHTDFGTSTVGIPVTRTYTIVNSGTIPLNLGANAVSLLGATCGEFTVTVQPAIAVAAAASTVFSVQYTPANLGTDLCQVRVSNDDPDESPYEFNVQGTGAAPLGTPPVMGNVPDQNATVGSAFNLALAGYVTLTEGDPITGYAIASGALPPGLTLNPATGVISGTPGAIGTYNVTVTASDKDGASNADAVQFVVAAAPAGGGVVPVPTLSEWGMLLLALLLAGVGMRQARVREP